MVAKWREGFDVVMAQRRSRAGETLMKRFVSYVGYLVINRIADAEIPPNTGDFRLMSRRVVVALRELRETLRQRYGDRRESLVHDVSLRPLTAAA